MTPRLLPAAALALATFGSVPARATGSTFQGDCGYLTVHRPLRIDSGSDTGHGGYYTGTAVFAGVIQPGSGVGIAEADVSCVLMVNGVAAATLGPVHVVGAGAAAGPMSFTLQVDDHVTMCTVVQYSDGTPTDEVCPAASSYCALNCAPYWEDIRSYIENDVCARQGGDVYAGDEWVLDCPPYGPY